MRAGWLVVGLLVGWTGSAFALRMAKPPIITQWNATTFAQLNDTLQALWDLTNGRYELDVATSNPNGSRFGRTGEVIAYNNSGSWKVCVNTDSSTTWRCSANALTAP